MRILAQRLFASPEFFWPHPSYNAKVPVAFQKVKAHNLSEFVPVLHSDARPIPTHDSSIEWSRRDMDMACDRFCAAELSILPLGVG